MTLSWDKRQTLVFLHFKHRVWYLSGQATLFDIYEVLKAGGRYNNLGRIATGTIGQRFVQTKLYLSRISEKYLFFYLLLIIDKNWATTCPGPSIFVKTHRIFVKTHRLTKCYSIDNDDDDEGDDEGLSGRPRVRQ